MSCFFLLRLWNSWLRLCSDVLVLIRLRCVIVVGCVCLWIVMFFEKIVCVWLGLLLLLSRNVFVVCGLRF